MDRLIEIEYWAMSVIERIEKGQPIEDSRVELKSDWIEPERAARRLAGHANAARGNPIIWLIGIDEKEGIKGIEEKSFLNWFSKTKQFFDGIYPEPIDLNIPYKGKTILCLYFLTDRSPYVVKNPSFGKKNGGPISLEVPWREGTEIMSASRNKLIQLLVPLQSKPIFTFLNGKVEKFSLEGRFRYFANIDVYVESTHNQVIQIPFHKISASISYGDNNDQIFLINNEFNPPHRMKDYTKFAWESVSKTIESTPDEVIISGSGRLIFTGEVISTIEIPIPMRGLKVFIDFLPIGFDQGIFLTYEVNKDIQ